MVVRFAFGLILMLTIACTNNRRVSFEDSNASPRIQEIARELESDLSVDAIGFPETRKHWEESMEHPVREFPIGEFRMQSIDDDKIITADDLRGHPYLLALVSADKDEQQYGFYHLLYQKYRSTGLKFIFLYFKDGRYHVSWDEIKEEGLSLPGFVANYDSSTFEKKLFPSPSSIEGNIYLVNSENIVVQSGRRTRPMNYLYWTLEHMYGGED